jgi:hypothetical protein
MGALFAKAETTPDIFVDFENVKPTASEMAIFAELDVLLKDHKELLSRIQEYPGCAELARMAMREPTKERELAAFQGLLKAVECIASFYQYTRAIEAALPRLWASLTECKESKDESKESKESKALTAQQALAKQFGDMLDFALRFDQTRMMRPNLSNDFSFYRRLLPKFSKNKDIKVRDDEASGMALFTADHMPMMSCISKTTARYCDEHEAGEPVRLVLAIIANSCQKMMRSTKFSRRETNLYCARVMTGAILLYDHITPDPGIFGKKCPIQLRTCVIALQKEFPQETGLMNALRYSPKNISRAPESYEALFPQ